MLNAAITEDFSRRREQHHSSLGMWRWILGSFLLFAAALLLIVQILMAWAAPIVKARVVETLRAHFHSRVELDQLSVALRRGVQVRGSGLRIYAPDEEILAGARSPLIQVQSFSFRAPVLGLLFKPMHVEIVFVRGATIQVPPRQMREPSPAGAARRWDVKIQVHEILCDDSTLVLDAARADKDSRVFQLRHIALYNAGPSAPWHYNAVLTNAIPRGEIRAQGFFGPWNEASPGASAVRGTFLFDNAELDTINGIAGTLRSTGSFDGQLNHIAVQGTTFVPDFSLDTAHHPMPLSTSFAAVVDGLSGDTYLQRIDARLAGSTFSCAGAVTDVKGRGHIVDLHVDVPNGRIEDFLQLSVKTEPQNQPPVLSGEVATRTELHIPPGPGSVSHRMSMKGTFLLRQIQFGNPATQDKIDMLSLRSRGEPKEAQPSAPEIRSEMSGQFSMHDDALHFEDLKYDLPGASVRLAGIYSLDGRRFEFTGDVRTKAELSRMMASEWKRVLLRPIDPIFRRHGAGADIPVRISGTTSAPRFGLHLFGGSEHSASSSQ